MKIPLSLLFLALSAGVNAQTTEYSKLLSEKSSMIVYKDTDPFVDAHIYTSLKKGSTHPDVQKLAAVLQEKGFLDKSVDISKIERFDDVLEQAVKTAQEAYGLVVDGLAGKQLYVNLSTSNRLKKISLDNWMSKLEETYKEAQQAGHKQIIIVNVASYTLRVINVETGKTELESPVIIGRPSRQTPLFKTNITGIKYNPTWTPPPGIMKHDVLPRLGKENDTWIQKHGLVIRDSEGDEVDPSTITAKEFREGGYHIHQPAGDDNALGLLKFETDNKENIYLHDTNARRLFDKADRAQSSGCIRVKEWLKLASLINGKPTEKIEAEVDKGKTYIERVKPIPVYIMYSLTDVINNKVVMFPDIYNISGDKVLRGIKG